MPHASAISPCLVVRVQPVGDADLIVSLLSAQGGRVDAVAKSARASRKRFGSSLRLFCEVDVSLGQGRGRLPLLSAATERRAWLVADVAYDQLCLASYAAELAWTASQPEHADAHLYDWLCAAWTVCNAPVQGALRPLRLGLDLTWLGVLGLLPDLSSCARCGTAASPEAAWAPSGEGLLCPSCAPDHLGRRRIGRQTFEGLGALVQGPVSADVARDLDAADLRNLEEQVAQWMLRALVSPLRSAAALRAIMALD